MPQASAPLAAAGCAGWTQAAAKSRRKIDPLEAPDVYVRTVYGDKTKGGDQLDVGNMTLQVQTQDDDASGLSTTVLLEVGARPGHAVLLLQGMSRFGSERGGLSDFASDLGAVFGSAQRQWVAAERRYLELLCADEVASIEVIGYSLGSEGANLLAARHGAYATTFGDLGTPKPVFSGLVPADAQAMRERIKSRVISLSLSGDMLVRLFSVGSVDGSVIELPGGLAGLGHQPEIYANAARDLRTRSRHPRTDAANAYPVPAWR